MTMFRYVFRSLFLLLVFASVPLFADDVNEDYYPFSARLTAEVRVGDAVPPLAAGTPFVLVRVEDDVAVIDVSRRGVFRVPVASTDIIDLTRDAMRKDADDAPETSRMAAFIGNKLLAADSGWRDRLPMPTALKFRTWIFLYADASAPETADVVRAAEAFYSGLDAAARETTALVFMEIHGSKAGIQAVADARRPSFQAMAGYLSRGYTASFAHLDEPSAVPALVAVNAAGRVLARHVGAGVPADFWAGCLVAR